MSRLSHGGLCPGVQAAVHVRIALWSLPSPPLLERDSEQRRGALARCGGPHQQGGEHPAAQLSPGCEGTARAQRTAANAASLLGGDLPLDQSKRRALPVWRCSVPRPSLGTKQVAPCAAPRSCHCVWHGVLFGLTTGLFSPQDFAGWFLTHVRQVLGRCTLKARITKATSCATAQSWQVSRGRQAG